MINAITHLLAYSSTRSTTYILFDTLAQPLIHWLIHPPANLQAHSFDCPFTGSFKITHWHLFIGSLTLSLANLPNCWLTHLLTYVLVQSTLLSQWLPRWLEHSHIGSLISLLNGPLRHWPPHPLHHSLTGSFISPLPGNLPHWLLPSLNHSLTKKFVDSFTSSLSLIAVHIGSFKHWLIYYFTQWLSKRAHPWAHSLAYTFFRSFTHILACSLPPSHCSIHWLTHYLTLWYGEYGPFLRLLVCWDMQQFV